MKGLRFEVGNIGGKDIAEQFSENLSFNQQEMARAATAAYRYGGNQAKSRGRTNIGSAGFSTKWQNALRVNVYPPSKDSLRPAIYMYHKIPYAGVFEDGETIKGSPTLWLPLPGLAQRFGRNERLTPLAFERATGQDLVPFRSPTTGRMMLGVRMKVPKSGKTPKLSLSRLRRGADAKQGVLATVPVFVGIPKVDIPKKFDLSRIMEMLAGELPALYLRHME